MNVLFLNTNYFPTIEELNRLENIQLTISGWRAELLREQMRKNFTHGEMFLSKQRFHNGIRDQWKIYAGLRQAQKLIVDSLIK
jgi:hypothetical protein